MSVWGRGVLAGLCIIGLTTVATPAQSKPELDWAQRGSVVPDYTFVSSPDLFNSDLGDLRKLRSFRGDAPNSWNRGYAKAIDFTFDEIQAQNPGDVLVAGDLVEGHWGIDSAKSGNFGPTSTLRQRTDALTRAADFYYSEWRKRFTKRGLDVHVALGDHEMGDNDWHGDAELARFKRSMAALRKALFSKVLIQPQHYPSHPQGPASGTAYATLLNPEVMLVTVDEFAVDGDNIETRLDPQQINWLDAVLRYGQETDIDWVIVQGHLPIIGPVRTSGSSGLFVKGGQQSAVWRLMKKYAVDLYLAGEVHRTTARHEDGITQITHGGLFAFGLTTFLTGKVFGDRLDLSLTGFRHNLGTKHGLWQTDTKKSPPGNIRYDKPSIQGSMVLTKDNEVVSQSGLLGPYKG